MKSVMILMLFLNLPTFLYGQIHFRDYYADHSSNEYSSDDSDDSISSGLDDDEMTDPMTDTDDDMSVSTDEGTIDSSDYEESSRSSDDSSDEEEEDSRREMIQYFYLESGCLSKRAKENLDKFSSYVKDKSTIIALNKILYEIFAIAYDFDDGETFSEAHRKASNLHDEINKQLYKIKSKKHTKQKEISKYRKTIIKSVNDLIKNAEHLAPEFEY